MDKIEAEVTLVVTAPDVIDVYIKDTELAKKIREKVGPKANAVFRFHCERPENRH